MHGDEGDVGLLGPQAFHEVGADVDRDDLVAEPVERVLDAGAGAERDAALQRSPALEDGDLHALASFRSGTTLLVSVSALSSFAGRAGEVAGVSEVPGARDS